MNPSVDVGCPPRPFRHLRMAQRCSPDLSSSRAPVHSALVQKSVTVITNPAGRLSIWMLGKSCALGKWKSAKSWQTICNQSNVRFTNDLAGLGAEGGNFTREVSHRRTAALWNLQSAPLGPRKDLILLTNCELIRSTLNTGPECVLAGGSAIRWRSLRNVQSALVRNCGGGNSHAGAWGSVGLPVRY